MLARPDKSGAPAGAVIDDAARGPLIAGGMIGLALLAVLIIWAATTNVSSAAVASGRVTVEGHRRAVQHRDGGPVATVNVREGDLVEAGEPLLVLDLTEVRAQAAILQATHIQALARLARLHAEVDGSASVRFPDELTQQPADTSTAAVVRQEDDLFRARLATHSSELSLLEQRIDGFRKQIATLRARLASTEEQLRLTSEEAAIVRPLVEKRLTTKSRALALDRNIAGLRGELQSLRAALAEQENGIRQAEIGIAQLQQERTETANKEITETEAQLSEIEPQLVSVRERLERGTLTAPERGYVLGLTVFGPGAVLVPGQTVLEIVPADDGLVLTVQIDPKDIDRVSVGQDVTVHLLSYQQRYQFLISGKLSSVSNDEIVDQAAQITYYRGVVEVNRQDLERSRATLVPGMPVQVMIETGRRTVMGYLLDPLMHFFTFSMRDD